MTKPLDTKWKKAVVQIAKELKKSNQISAVIGSAMLGGELKKVKEKKQKFKEMEERRTGVS